MSYFNGKNILITGVNGFVGSWMAKEMLDRGATVYGVLRGRCDGHLNANLRDRGVDSRIKILDGEIEDVSFLANALDASNPDCIFHLAAQSFVPRSFKNPTETMETNTMGTLNLLEAVRIKDIDPKLIFAGSSEEYGLVFSSEKQYEEAKKKYGSVFPEPEGIPEIPISEKNPFRPMSPYAVSKVHGEMIFRNYFATYGLKAVVSRAFNHEGAGRGPMFVTSAITRQVMKLKFGEINEISIGNVSAFRDWSHISDIINGYALIAEKGAPGDVYNQGSMRTNSVLTYLLLSLEGAGWKINKIRTEHGSKEVDSPTEQDEGPEFGVKFKKTKVDRMILKHEIDFELKDGGIIAETDKGDIKIAFDKNRFRPSEVPILLSDTKKIYERLGFSIRYDITDIINDQLNYYMDNERRNTSFIG